MPSTWIYLSPHFDDVALSCGGLVWEQVRRGDTVSVWTICGGKPPGPLSPFAEELHRRWGIGSDSVAERVREDRRSCAAMGAKPRHFPIPDCIYRRGSDQAPLYASEAAIFGRLHAKEAPLVSQLTAKLARLLPETTEVVCPMGLGEHVDHQLVRLATEGLGRKPWYYADVPYVLQSRDALAKLRQEGWCEVRAEISPEGLEAWWKAIMAHASQVGSFWPDLEAMRAAICTYSQENGGAALWKRAESGR